MGECNHGTPERALTGVDDVTVVFHKVVSHDKHTQELGEDDEPSEETVHLRSNCLNHEDAENRQDEERSSEGSLEGGEQETPCPAFCVRGEWLTSCRERGARGDKPKRCPGLGLFYAILATVFFSIIHFLVKTIQDIHAIEISAIRCFFQMLFVVPLLIHHNSSFHPSTQVFILIHQLQICVCFPFSSLLHASLSFPLYLNPFILFVTAHPPQVFSIHSFLMFTFFISCYIGRSNHSFSQSFIHPSSSYICSSRTGFLGPRDKRIYLVLRGFFGSNAMILLYYAVQQMSLADATVIMFSNPVFTSLLAWIFLKEKCTIWDCVFTVFTITGVILIARPPFLFGEHPAGIEGNYANHVKGAIAAFAGAVAASFTFVILRKMGKSVHYYLSVWYYAVVGFIESVITVSILGEWKIPNCGRDRWIMMLIAILGIVGQTFLTKALQIEKAGPVALVRTVDVVLAFFFQFIFFNQALTWWSLGGALCVVVSTSGVAVRKWYTNSRKP